jgi:hypothetical protein
MESDNVAQMEAMPTSGEAPGNHVLAANAWMLGALGILAYAASMMTHEALGHGGYCIAAGGHNAMLTGWGERCNFPGTQPFGIEAAGPGLQFLAGLLSWWALPRLPKRASRLRYFFWLYMVFNLLVSSGYVAFSGVTDFGDAAVIIAGLSPHMVWRGLLMLLGAAAYYLSMWIAAAELKRLLGTSDGSRSIFRLVWIPYAAAGIFACCAAALNRTMPTGVAVGLAAASSFGAAFGMLRLADMQRRMTPRPSPGIHIAWSAGWALAALVVIAAFLLVIGPGLE